VSPELVERILAHLDFVDEVEKEVDSISDWQLIEHRPTGSLQWQSAVRLSGRLGGGAAVRLMTPADVWEKDVYGHIEVRPPVHPQRMLRINPVEWRPRRSHRNPNWGPEEHRLETYRDRWHPYNENRMGGIEVFLQSKTGLALPLPAPIASFSQYLHVCSKIWKCPNLKDVPPPPWSPSLL
jgi:hypothetical protein